MEQIAKISALAAIITLFSFMGSIDLDNCGCGSGKDIDMPPKSAEICRVIQVLAAGISSKELKTESIAFLIEYPPKQTA